mgnify:CR=1
MSARKYSSLARSHLLCLSPENITTSQKARLSLRLLQLASVWWKTDGCEYSCLPRVRQLNACPELYSGAQSLSTGGVIFMLS